MYKFKKNFKNTMKKRMEGTFYNYAFASPDKKTAVVFCNIKSDLWKNDEGIMFEYKIEKIVIEECILSFKEFQLELMEQLKLTSTSTKYEKAPHFGIKTRDYVIDLKLINASGPLKDFMPTKYQCFYRDIIGLEQATKLVSCKKDTGITTNYVRGHRNMFEVYEASEAANFENARFYDYIRFCNKILKNYEKFCESPETNDDQLRSFTRDYDTQSDDSEQTEEFERFLQSDQSELSGQFEYTDDFVEYSTDSEESQESNVQYNKVLLPTFMLKKKIGKVVDIQSEKDHFQVLVLEDKKCKDLCTVKVFIGQDEIKLNDGPHCYLSINKISKLTLDLSPVNRSVSAAQNTSINGPSKQNVNHKVCLTLLDDSAQEINTVVNYKCIILENNHSIPKKTVVCVTTNYANGISVDDFYYVSGGPNTFAVKKIIIQDLKNVQCVCTSEGP